MQTAIVSMHTTDSHDHTIKYLTNNILSIFANKIIYISTHKKCNTLSPRAKRHSWKKKEG